MNFQHTDDRRMLADTLDRYIAERYGFEARQRIAASAEGYSADQWRQFAELGAIGALFGEAEGGLRRRRLRPRGGIRVARARPGRRAVPRQRGARRQRDRRMPETTSSER